ncbi:MAG: DUF3025 domain-containing protein [Inhella sp.]|jgi:hypothetical protein|uniref:DUF3025 domain-containing protein n=1 Tax=Inhella sp. TaxID=1921806 RepID=UPI0022BCDE65|nr:DUF3025 domain-containing protein [Inhella sp.]MCZ8235356.1 DUF3025 domain-containing protein [Inhella sp.]
MARWLPLTTDDAVAALNALPGAPRTFVPSQALPPGDAYETFIARTGTVPTRHHLHDLFNGLVWCAEPEIKARLNALQADHIAASGVGGTRGPVRDALTLFDENGATWLECPPPIADAWRRRDWRALFVTHRALWASVPPPRLVGHALMEQLAQAPRKSLCAHVLLDDPLALAPGAWATKPFLPLPVLGVPGWWPANADPTFYDDPAVFRPLRSPRLSHP